MAISRSSARCKEIKKIKARNNFVFHLPAQIIDVEILPRLPVKSLLRFKSVCKSWNSLISTNPYFIKSQLDLNPNRDSLILRKQHDKCYCNSFISRYTYIVGCIDGLVCVFRWHNNDASKVLEIAIWNPATNQCLVIPYLPKKSVQSYDVLLGFGFDSVGNDFKVIYGTFIEKQPLAVDVYSCKAARWKKIAPSNILYEGDIYRRKEPIIVDRSPFWLIQKRQDAKISLAVLSFDVRDEVFRLFPGFSYIDNNNLKLCVFMNFSDSFAIMVYDEGMDFVNPIDVYIFNQKCSVWDKISIGPFRVREPTIELFKLIPCFRNGEILFVDVHCRRLYSLNPETHTIKILKEDSYGERIYSCFNYSESLSFIEGMKPISDKREQGIFKFLLGHRLELAPGYEYI